MKLLNLAWLALLALLTACAPQTAHGERVWTQTEPAINATHVFLGEINRKGKPTGYHARPGGEDPRSARVLRKSEGPNAAGVYTAQVAVRDPITSEWKQKFSTFFPDRLSHQQVIAAILHAYRNREHGNDEPWRGPSGLGFPIQGYTLRDGRINTAYPIYVKDRR